MILQRIIFSIAMLLLVSSTIGVQQRRTFYDGLNQTGNYFSLITKIEDLRGSHWDPLIGSTKSYCALGEIFYRQHFNTVMLLFF